MMAQMSDYLENKVVDHILGTTTFSKPASVFLAFFTTDPTDAGIGTEVSGGSYSRIAATFVAASGGNASNSADITFPAPTADWGTITHYGIFDAASGGNLLIHGPISPGLLVTNGSTPITIVPGALTVTGA